MEKEVSNKEQGASTKEQVNAKPELKKLDPESNEFKANGVTYYKQLDGISVGRFMYYEQYVQQAVFGTDFLSMYNSLKRIYESLTKGNDVLGGWQKAAQIAYNQMASVKERSEAKNNKLLYLCTLFINKVDEDISDWDIRLADAKIDDWKKEGIDMADFFLLAVKLIEGFKSAYQEPLNHQPSEGSGMNQ